MTNNSKSLPMADSIPAGTNVDKLRRTIAEQGLVGASNNTKWNKLIRLMRERSAQEKWVPSYRSKWLNGHISEWDCEGNITSVSFSRCALVGYQFVGK